MAGGRKDTVSTWEDPKLRQRIPGLLLLGHDAYLPSFTVGWVLVCLFVVFISFPLLHWHLQSLAWKARCALSCPSSLSFSFASQLKSRRQSQQQISKRSFGPGHWLPGNWFIFLCLCLWLGAGSWVSQNPQTCYEPGYDFTVLVLLLLPCGFFHSP